MFHKIALSSALNAGTASTAFAGGLADPVVISAPVVVTAAPVVMSNDWTGFYVGGSFGAGEVDVTGAGSLDGSYDINRAWSASADYRFDIADNRSAIAGFGLTYNNECVTVDLSVNRRYSTSTSVEPSTNIGFNIGLRGFAASSGKERYVRSCRN